MKMLDEPILKTFELHNLVILVILCHVLSYCVMAISRNRNRFVMGIERSTSQKVIRIVYENIPIQP